MGGRRPILRLKPGIIRVIIAVTLLNLMVVGIVGFALLRNHSQQTAEATLNAENLSRVLEQNLGRFIDKVDLTLLAVIEEIERQEQAGGVDRARLEEFIARHDARLPEALGIRVVNAAGTIEYAVSNVVNAGISVAGREHFTRLRDDPKAGLFISKPFVGKLNPQPLLTLARRRTGPDGSFAGIVHVALAIRTLTDMFATVDLGGYGTVGLWDADAAMVARFTRLDVPAGGGATPSARLRELIAADAAATPYRAVSGVDGIERIFAYRKVDRWPLYLVVGVAADDYLATWRQEVAWFGGLAGLFLLASVAAAAAIGRGIVALERSRAEALAAHRQSDLVLGSVGEGIVGLDCSGRVTFANPAARRLLQWRDDEGPGLDFRDVTRQPAGSPLDLAATATQGDGEVYWRRDGSSFPVEATLAAVVEDGATTGAVTIFRDVGERKRAEEEMRRTLAGTRALQNILRLSLEDRSLESILDAALGELLSLSWLKLEQQGAIFLMGGEDGPLVMAASRNLNPEIQRKCATVALGTCLCGAAAKSGQVVFTNDLDHRHEISFDGIRPHGHYCVPIATAGERLGVLNTYVPHGHPYDRNEAAFLQMVADTLAGIIQRKRVEGLATALLDAPTDVAFLMDRDGLILAANEAFNARFHLPPGEVVVGRRFFDMLPPDLAAARWQQLQGVLADGQPRHVHDERAGRFYDNRLYPIADLRGRVAQVAVFSHDVTDQRLAAQAREKALADLARSNEELEQFAYVASHDLRQPLRMVSNYIGLIGKRLGDAATPEMREFIGYAIDGARRMDRLIIDLLEYSRTGRNSEFEPVPLAEVAQAVLRTLEPTVAEAGARVAVAENLPTVPGDRSELTRLLQNLVGNAIKYRSPTRPAEIELGWRPEGEAIVLWVKDNGIGIAPQHRERAFRIFQRLVSAEEYEGTGIGLAVCKKIVEHHGGSIRLDSELDRGCTFFIELPAAHSA